MKKAKRTTTDRRDASRRSPSQRLRGARLPLAVCALAFLVYSRSLFCGFVRDDTAQIIHNRQVQSWQYLPQLLSSHLWSQVARQDVSIKFYRPIFSVWMLVIHTFGGLEPWFWHLSSILLHVAATYLLFRVVQRLTQSDVGAVAGAAIFAVHPIHVEAVTWVSASCELLFAIFTLAALLALLNRDKNGIPRVWMGALWFGAGLFAKETGIAMLAILPFLAWAQLKGVVGRERRLWMAAYPYVVVGAACLLARWGVMHRVGVEGGEHSWAETFFTAPSIFLFYLQKLFLPWRLSGSYIVPIGSSATAFWLQFSAVLGGLAVVAWVAIRYSPIFGLAAALIAIPVLPALAVVRIYPEWDMAHDRYLYVPSFALSLLVAIVAKHASTFGKPIKVATTAVLIVVLIAFSAETIAQQRYYQDDVAFYSRVIELNPSDAFARSMLGNVYLQEGRNDLALVELRTASQIAPDNQKVSLLVARGLFAAGEKRDAEAILMRLIEARDLDPRRQRLTKVALANVEINMGNLGYAQQLLEDVQQSDDRVPELHWALGMLYQRQGLLQQAFVEFEKEYEITGDESARQRSAALARLIKSRSGGNSAQETSGR